MKQKLLLLAAVFFGVMAFMFTFQQINAEKKKIMESAMDVDVIRVVKIYCQTLRRHSIDTGNSLAAERQNSGSYRPFPDSSQYDPYMERF